MSLNVLVDPFFPVVTRRGTRRWLTFAELADDGDDPPVDFDWPRADFNVAAYELAVGVATLALRPTRELDWLGLWRDAPDPDALREPSLRSFTRSNCLARGRASCKNLAGSPAIRTHRGAADRYARRQWSEEERRSPDPSRPLSGARA